MNLRRAVRGLLIAALASVLVYAALTFLTDAPAVMRALRSFPGVTLAAILALSMGCYLVRGVRWGLLMRGAGFPVSVGESVYLHFAGQTMAVSPGRVGEVFKPWLARRTSGMPLSRGIALVFAERVADLIGACLLALGGVSLIHGGLPALIGGLAVIVLGASVAASSRVHRLLLAWMGRHPRLARYGDRAAGMSETVLASLSWRTLAWSVPCSFVAWGLEGVGFSLCLRALGFDGLSLPAAVSVYAVSTIVGAFSFLPGGIGLTEASMAGLLVAAGMPVSEASAATLVTRVATLWWAVLVGWVALASRPGRLREAFAENAGDTAGSLGG